MKVLVVALLVFLLLAGCWDYPNEEILILKKDLNTEMLRQDDVWHVYGGFDNTLVTITTTNQNEWYKLTNGDGNLWVGDEATGLTLSNDVMTFDNTADYFGTVSITLSALNGKDYKIRLYNNTQAKQMGNAIGVTTTGAANFANVTLPLYIVATAGDELQMEIACTSGATADPTLRSAVFYLSYLHD